MNIFDRCTLLLLLLVYKFDLKLINRLLFKYDIGPFESESVVEVLVNCCSSRFATAALFKYGTSSKTG